MFFLFWLVYTFTRNQNDLSHFAQFISHGSVPVFNQATAPSVPRQRLYKQFDLTINLNSHAATTIDHKYILYI